MIAYFPKPYLNELYYSILARYHHYSGEYFSSHTLKELTGRARRVNIELPMGLNTLISKVSHFSIKYSQDYFIKNHTIIPIVIPFKNVEWVEKLYKGNFEELRRSLFGDRLGDVNSKEHLYFCPNCLKEQIKQYGEGYWNRIHQIPGIFVCNVHSIALSKHSLNIHSIRSDDEFILPKLEDIGKNDIDYSPDVLKALFNLAEDVEYLLEKKYDSFSEEYFYEKYVTLLEIKGIAYPFLKREEKLKSLLSEFYPIKFLEILNSSLVNNNNSWVPRFNGINKIDTLHPIRHLLLMRLLCGSAQEFFENDYSYKPFGSGPWICMNPLADHYLQNVVEKVEVSVHSGKRFIQGDMICSCGFVYRLREWEKSPLDVEYFNNRIMEKGHIWEQEFNTFIQQKLKINEIAKRTKMTRPTIRKILRDRQMQNESETRKEEIAKNIDIKTSEYKRIWLKMCQEHPLYSRHKLNSLNRAVYAWLRKYDKDWIETNSPPKKLKGIEKRKTYSLESDNNLLNKAKELISNWPDYEESRMKLIRKSKTKILTLLGFSSCIHDLKRKYPLTFTYIESIHESINDFRKRRIRNILETKLKDVEVSFNTVAELAHVRTYIRTGGYELKQYIEELIKEHNLAFNTSDFW